MRGLAANVFAVGMLFAAVAAAGEDGASLDKAWIKAVLARDIGALDRMYAPDLVYAHATGVVDTKASYLEKIRSGRQVYKTFDQDRITERAYPGVIVTHSWVRVTGTNPAGPFDDKVMMLHVWVRRGDGWVLAAHQTTRIQ